VQEQIFATITKYLPEDAYTTNVNLRREEALNFGLFRRRLTDVLMSHGAADKNYFVSKVHGEPVANYYKHVFVPGKWLKRRLMKNKDVLLGEDQIHVVGWPRLDALLEMQRKHDAGKAPDAGKPRRKKILWAPTHDWARREVEGGGEEQVSLSSYPDFLEFVPELEKHFDVETSLHPRNREDKKPTAEKLVEADYVIADLGTMVYEAWSLGKPVLFPHWILGPRLAEHRRKSAEAQLLKNRIGYHPDSFSEMLEMLHSDLALSPEVTAFRDDYISPKYRGRSGERVATLLLELAQTRERYFAPVEPLNRTVKSSRFGGSKRSADFVAAQAAASAASAPEPGTPDASGDDSKPIVAPK
jgi:hypothetical protein